MSESVGLPQVIVEESPDTGSTGAVPEGEGVVTQEIKPLPGSEYILSDAEKKKVEELRGILKGRSSFTKDEVSGMPMFMVWNDRVIAFERFLLDRGYSKAALNDYVLSHLLTGSGHIEGINVAMFDLPDGKIENFIRTGEF